MAFFVVTGKVFCTLEIAAIVQGRKKEYIRRMKQVRNIFPKSQQLDFPVKALVRDMLPQLMFFVSNPGNAKMNLQPGIQR